jgi:hypothetical protein
MPLRHFRHFRAEVESPVTPELNILVSTVALFLLAIAYMLKRPALPYRTTVQPDHGIRTRPFAIYDARPASVTMAGPGLNS